MVMTDTKLVKSYLAGDKVALEVLVNRYIKLVYSVSYQYLGDRAQAEDVTQETFMKVWRNLKKFKPNKNLAPYRTAGSGSGFKTWILTIAKNTALDQLRKKKEIVFSEFENENGDNIILESLADKNPLASEAIHTADKAKALQGKVKKILPVYQKVLALRYEQGFNFREIAEMLGESINTVKSRNRRALAILRGMIQGL